MFLSTAYLCLKGPSGLPSVLPSRECLDMAKQKNRRIRLLCKGLEHFREALYAEPMVDATSEKAQSTSNAASPVAETTADKGSSDSADTTADHETRTSVKKPCKYIMANGDDLFKSLFSAEKTLPTSPESVASSSTAVDSSSRKVSPSGSDIKDFAYPSSNKDHALDPTAITEENTKKQLLKQLKKKAATEEKDSRKVVKLAAQNEALNAELKLANATVQNRDTQTELAKTYANAMILSNVVLRQAVLDVGHQLRSEQDGNPKGEALQNHLRIVDAVSLSAHSRMARLENLLPEQGQLEDVRNTGRNTTEENEPEVRVEKSEISNTLENHRPNTVANLKDAKSANRTIQNDRKQQRIEGEGHSAEETTEQGEANVEMIPADLQGKELAVGKGQGTLHTIVTTSEDSIPGKFEWSESSEEHQVFRTNRGGFPPSEVENLVLEVDGDDAVAQKPIEDALATHNDVQGTDVIANCDISAIYEFLEPAGPATMWGILQSNQTVGETGPGGDHGDGHNDVQGANSAGKGDTKTRYEFLEPAGPATLWGILQSNQTIREFDTESNQNETSATQEPISDANYGQDMDCGRGGDVGTTYEFSEPAGPATMWGILLSNQTVEETGPEGDHTKDTVAQDSFTDETDTLDLAKAMDHGCEDGLNQIYEFSEPSGAATLWGILQSIPCEEVKEDYALILGEPCLGSGSDGSPTDQEPGHQEPETREPEVEELTGDPVQEEDHTRSKADAGEGKVPEAGSPDPQKKDFHFNRSETDMNGAERGLDEPQSISGIEIPRGQEEASTITEIIHDDFGNDEKTAEQGTANGDVHSLLSETNESTIVQGQDQSRLTSSPLNNDIYDHSDLSILGDLGEMITTPASSPVTSVNHDILYRDEIRVEIQPNYNRSDTPTEPEKFDFPCTIPKPKSKSDAEIKAEKINAEKKKAEHKRYKAKKRAEAAAKRRLKKEEVEAPEPPKTLAQIQAEEDASLGDRRLKLQAKRQEQQDKAASLRGVVRSSRGHLIY